MIKRKADFQQQVWLQMQKKPAVEGPLETYTLLKFFTLE